jgi:hypothetical protein
MNFGSLLSPLFEQSKKVADKKIQNDISTLCEELTSGIIDLSEKAKRLNELKEKYAKSQSESQTEESDASEKPEEKKSWFSGLFGSNEKKKDDTQDATQPVDELPAKSTESGSPVSPVSPPPSDESRASLGDSSIAFDSLASTASDAATTIGSPASLVEPLPDASIGLDSAASNASTASLGQDASDTSTASTPFGSSIGQDASDASKVSIGQDASDASKVSIGQDASDASTASKAFEKPATSLSLPASTVFGSSIEQDSAAPNASTAPTAFGSSSSLESTTDLKDSPTGIKIPPPLEPAAPKYEVKSSEFGGGKKIKKSRKPKQTKHRKYKKSKRVTRKKNIKQFDNSAQAQAQAQAQTQGQAQTQI